MDYLTAREQGTAGEGALFSTRNSSVLGKRKKESGSCVEGLDDHIRRPRPI